jgi:hypothetical protein
MDASAVDPMKRAAKALTLDLVTFRIFESSRLFNQGVNVASLLSFRF